MNFNQNMNGNSHAQMSEALSEVTRATRVLETALRGLSDDVLNGRNYQVSAPDARNTDVAAYTGHLAATKAIHDWAMAGRVRLIDQKGS